MRGFVGKRVEKSGSISEVVVLFFWCLFPLISLVWLLFTQFRESSLRKSR
jgi:hypothetical protein